MRLPHPYDALAPTLDDWRRLPPPEPVEPFAFLEDVWLPRELTPVEPCSFGLACVKSTWGQGVPQN